ncbi:RadC family protein [Vibrio hippocampi]|uniref:MPN domain-containing protein n=1 Tax=Vibrio hippocampi TaxID=654686 RepID=A0ABN8DIF6_9VIBR|nr:DNA repair protein RadC [Vibrio hippocampi]CAH0526257.1 hypothetical protein VHP8226_01709 [Vibrio hippocampi]
MKDKSTSYLKAKSLPEHQVLEQTAQIIANRHLKGDVFTSPNATKEFLTYKLAQHEREVFAVLLLDNQHRLIEYNELFFGTIDAATVYPREVVKLALERNAAAVIFAHNHPSGQAEPSQADRRITSRLSDALALIDIRVLDHFVIGETPVSFAERGLI